METAQEQAAREVRNAYVREWRAKNRDKVKTYNRNYWAKKAAQKAERKDGKTE